MVAFSQEPQSLITQKLDEPSDELDLGLPRLQGLACFCPLVQVRVHRFAEIDLGHRHHFAGEEFLVWKNRKYSADRWKREPTKRLKKLSRFNEFASQLSAIHGARVGVTVRRLTRSTSSGNGGHAVTASAEPFAVACFFGAALALAGDRFTALAFFATFFFGALFLPPLVAPPAAT
jgi:hypothetical protein